VTDALVPVPDVAAALGLARAPMPKGAGAATVDVDGARLARELKHAGRPRIGLLPATPGAPVLPLASALGVALAALTDTVVLVLDPDGRLPGTQTARASMAGTVLARQLGPSVCALVPSEAARTGAKVDAVEVLYAFAGEAREGAVAHVLVDLTGFVQPGELLGVLRILDGIIVVGEAARSTEGDLKAASAKIPGDLNLGVLLVQ
jgi:hypothetical protein